MAPLSVIYQWPWLWLAPLSLCDLFPLQLLREELEELRSALEDMNTSVLEVEVSVLSLTQLLRNKKVAKQKT